MIEDKNGEDSDQGVISDVGHQVETHVQHAPEHNEEEDMNKRPPGEDGRSNLNIN